jgi:hypothetical protein
VTIEQRIAQQLDSTLTDAEFDVLEAEAQADAIPFRDGGNMPSSRPAIPLDHDGRRPRVGPRRGIQPVTDDERICAALRQRAVLCRREATGRPLAGDRFAEFRQILRDEAAECEALASRIEGAA